MATEATWYENINNGNDLLNIVITKSKSKQATISLNKGLRHQAKKRKCSPKEEVELQASAATLVKHYEQPLDDALCALLATSSLHCPPQKDLLDYWSSPEAKMLFCPQEGEMVQQSIREQIKMLSHANK